MDGTKVPSEANKGKSRQVEVLEVEDEDERQARMRAFLAQLCLVDVHQKTHDLVFLQLTDEILRKLDVASTSAHGAMDSHTPGLSAKAKPTLPFEPPSERACSFYIPPFAPNVLRD